MLRRYIVIQEGENPRIIYEGAESPDWSGGWKLNHKKFKGELPEGTTMVEYNSNTEKWTDLHVRERTKVGKNWRITKTRAALISSYSVTEGLANFLAERFKANPNS